MGGRLTTRERGFTLLEMMVSLALGAIVLAAAGQIYIQGVSATWTVSQRAEMQQDFRAASNMLTTDLSLAGAGLGNGVAIALPSGTTPKYGCDQTGACHINGAAGTYPLNGGTPYLYGLIPGYNKGPILNATQGATDVVTVVYTDANFYLNCYIPKVTAKGVVTFAPPTSPATWATEGCLPNSSVAAPQAVNDTAAGLTPGDLVLMTLGGNTIVAEVTGAVTTTVTAGVTKYVVPFANFSGTTVDPLKMNQTPTNGGLNTAALNAAGSASAAPCGGTGPCRLLVITYYIDNTSTPPILMRQISGHTPMPVVENVAYMKFSYDLFNSAAGSPAVNQPNPGSGDANDTASNGLLPNQITKINIQNMAMNSTLNGSMFGTTGYQRMDLQTSVSARNLTFTNNYNN
ncbi:MAG: prepilin-type N-terminal cleavage/methylation domain-containing protein [Terriglobales bacterium]